MRTFTRALMCGLFAASFTFVACDDEDSTPADTSTPDTTADTAVPDTSVPDTSVPDTSVPDTSVPDTTVPDTEQDTAVPDTTVPDTTPTDTTPTGACTNAADMAIITSGDKDPSAKASECGAASCIAQLFVSIDAFDTCVTTCMKNAALPGFEFTVSDGCTACYVGSVRCTAEFCGLNDPNKSCVPTGFGGQGADSAACAECRGDNGCVTSFYTCSGLTPPTP